MNIDSKEIKKHIKEHYNKSKGWREGFKSTKNDTRISKLINYLKRKQLAQILKKTEKLNIKNILDAGCGNGEYSLALARNFPEAKIHAIDFSTSMCDLTKKRAEEANLQNIIVREGDIENIQFENNVFDLVLCIDLLHHIPNESIHKGLSELQRVAKQDTHIIVDFKNKHNPLLYYQHQKDNRITYYRSNRTLKEMTFFLNKQGITVESSKGSGGPRQIAPYVTVFCKKVVSKNEATKK